MGVEPWDPLASQCKLTGELLASERPCLKGVTDAPEDVLAFTHTSTHTSVHTQMFIHTYVKQNRRAIKKQLPTTDNTQNRR